MIPNFVKYEWTYRDNFTEHPSSYNKIPSMVFLHRSEQNIQFMFHCSKMKKS